MRSIAVEVQDLVKSYGPVTAVSDVSFSIPEGTIFGLLGPNGAGKTSIVEMIEGLREPDRGRIRVHGIDPTHDPMKVRSLIGAQLQTTRLQDKIRVAEALELFASLYDKPQGLAWLLEAIGLDGHAETYYEHLSGGLKQRLAIGLALAGNPRVLFLDEPTTGLDAQIRRDIHGLVANLRATGRTIVLTTHYIEEAEKLCDCVGILNRGRLLVVDSPAAIVASLGCSQRVEAILARAEALTVLRQLEGVDDVMADAGRYVLSGRSAARMMASLASYAGAADNALLSAVTRTSTLEDAYLQLTGRRPE